jgi:hypothetical protein
VEPRGWPAEGGGCGGRSRSLRRQRLRWSLAVAVAGPASGGHLRTQPGRIAGPRAGPRYPVMIAVFFWKMLRKSYRDHGTARRRGAGQRSDGAHWPRQPRAFRRAAPGQCRPSSRAAPMAHCCWITTAMAHCCGSGRASAGEKGLVRRMWPGVRCLPVCPRKCLLQVEAQHAGGGRSRIHSAGSRQQAAA